MIEPSAFDRMILRRDWATLRGQWLTAIPTISPPGSAPPGSLADVLDLRGPERDVGASPPMPLRKEIPGLRPAVLHEGLYLLHKASHVVSAAELHVQTGICSWSLSSAYQGSVFACRAVLAFLGIALATVDGHYVLVDLWPGSPARDRRGVELGTDWPTPNVWPLGQIGHMDHRLQWSLFQRVLRVARVDCWQGRASRLVGLLHPADIPHQRNLLHYRAHLWVCDDLLSFAAQPDFGTFEWAEDQDREELDPDRDDFTLQLSFVLLKLASCLLEDLARLSPRLAPEWELYVGGFDKTRHPLARPPFAPG